MLAAFSQCRRAVAVVFKVICYKTYSMWDCPAYRSIKVNILLKLQASRGSS